MPVPADANLAETEGSPRLTYAELTELDDVAVGEPETRLEAEAPVAEPEIAAAPEPSPPVEAAPVAAAEPEAAPPTPTWCR